MMSRQAAFPRKGDFAAFRRELSKSINGAIVSEHDEFEPSRMAMISFRSNALQGLTRGIAPAVRTSVYRTTQWHNSIRPFASTQGIHKKFVDFTSKQDVSADLPPKAGFSLEAEKEHKGSRKNAGKTSSLRRVAVEAQRSRSFVKGRGNKRFVDPDVDTKVRLPYAKAL
jgi:hypothetical protein